MNQTQQNGDGNKPIWVTDFGWGTIDGMDVPANPGYEYTADIDQARQAEYIVAGYAWARDWRHTGVMFLGNLNLWPEVGPQDALSKFSILHGDGTPRPAYEALKEAIAD